MFSLRIPVFNWFYVVFEISFTYFIFFEIIYIPILKPEPIGWYTLTRIRLSEPDIFFRRRIMTSVRHNIIPLIESYYHTFTPLERTIGDFFIHNTEEQDFSSRTSLHSFSYLRHLCHVSRRNAAFTDTGNLSMNTSRS